jgi:hypothetical protein
VTACVGTPVSWLRLERHALAADGEVRDHLAVCPACSASFSAITDDIVALPPLAVPDKRARSWLRWLIPTMTAAAAAAVILLVIVRRPGPAEDNVTTIKGGGTVVLGVVRERAGAIRSDVTTFATGDRWKITLTCEPGPVWVDVSVTDPHGIDYPLGPTQIACGNQIAVPGAFSITGREINVVCARLDVDAIPARTPPHPGEPGVACMTLRPE